MCSVSAQQSSFHFSFPGMFVILHFYLWLEQSNVTLKELILSPLRKYWKIKSGLLFDH